MRGKGISSRVKMELLFAALVFLAFSLINDGCSEALGRRSSKPLAPQLDAEQILEAEHRLWELGYWAGPVDGKFDSDSHMR